MKRAHALVKHQQNKIDDAAVNINQTFVSGRTLLLGLSAAALVIGLFAAWRVAPGITRPLGLAVEAAQRVAAGDLSHRLATAGTDEIGQLLLLARHECQVARYRALGARQFRHHRRRIDRDRQP